MSWIARCGKIRLRCMKSPLNSLLTSPCQPAWFKAFYVSSGTLTSTQPTVIINHKNSSPHTMPRSWNVYSDVASHLRQTILCNENYQKTILPDQSSCNIQPREGTMFLQSLKGASNFAEQIMAKSKNLGDDQLKNVMGDLATMKVHNKIILRMLEMECTRRMNSLSLDDALYIMDAFFLAGYQPTNFLELLLSAVDMKWKSLDVKYTQVVQLLFYIGIFRNAPVQLLDQIEAFVGQNLSKFSGLELGLVCHSFFGSNRSMRSYELLDGIGDKILQDIPAMSLPLICNVLKVFRHARYEKVEFYEKLGTSLCETRKFHGKCSLSSLNHIAVTYATMRMSHTPLFRELSLKLQEILKWPNVRIKDLARLVWAFSLLRHPMPPGLLDCLTTSLRDPQLNRNAPEILTEAHMSLAMNGQYLEDCISNLFSDRSLQFKKRRVIDQTDQLLVFDTCVGIECPNYSGNRLPEDFVQSVQSKEINKLGLELQRRVGLAATWWSLQQLLGGQSKVLCHYICNFSRIADLEIWLDQENAPIAVPFSPTIAEALDNFQHLVKKRFELQESKFNGQTGGILERLLQEEKNRTPDYHNGDDIPLAHILPSQDISHSKCKRRLVIKVLGWNQYFANKPELLGSSQLGLRLLAELGCEVLVLNPAQAVFVDTAGRSLREEFLKEFVIDKLGIKLP